MNSDNTHGSNSSTGRLSKTRSYLLPLYPMYVRFPHHHFPPGLFTLFTSTIVHLQSKKANFDASHELEELLLEDNPLKAKQRKNRDVNLLSAEMRQMEEQYGAFSFPPLASQSFIFRFTSYDFKKMQRRSYYPSNQQIVSSITATTSTSGLPTSRPVTPDQPVMDITPAAHYSFEGDSPSPVENKFSEKSYS